jgi:hypothetical protein
MYAVKNVRVDLYYDQDPPFSFLLNDYQVYTEYVAPRAYRIVIRKLNGMETLPDPLRILVETDGEAPEVITVHLETPDVVLERTSAVDLVPDQAHPVTVLPKHPSRGSIRLDRLSREEFNATFRTDLVMLPTSMFAVGITSDKRVMIYHEGNGIHSSEYYNVEAPIHHLVWVALNTRRGDGGGMAPFYMVVASTDGYLENVPWRGERCVPRRVGDQECRGLYLPPPCADDEYPVFHSQKWVWAQSWHVGLPYVRGIVDRHYFYHNLYHPFRSFHGGIPFRDKTAKIVYAGQARDAAHNFMDPSMQAQGVAPRAFFKTEIAPKHDFVACPAGWLDRRAMVAYKYILDIDGAASTWDATAWKLNSGSVIIKPRSVWRQWFYDRYLPGVHYVEIANDFSDLAAAFAWCESHPSECEAMVARCRQLFQEVYSYSRVIEDTRRTLLNSVTPSAIHQWVDWVVYINLDRRTDRRTQMEAQLDAYGIRYDRFPAIPHDFGIVGCTRSHMTVYQMAKARGARNVWILEDDLEFLVPRDVLETEVRRMFETVPTFDVAMMAYKLLETAELPDAESASCVRVLCAQTASCYIVQAHYYDKLIGLYTHTLPLLETTGQHWFYANDQSWKALQHEDRWIATKTRMGKQRDGYSDNAKCVMTYGF